MKTTIKGTVLWINHDPLKLNQKMLLVGPVTYKRNGNVLHAKNGVYAQTHQKYGVYAPTRPKCLYRKGSNGVMITNLMDAEFINSGVFA